MSLARHGARGCSAGCDEDEMEWGRAGCAAGCEWISRRQRCRMLRGCCGVLRKHGAHPERRPVQSNTHMMQAGKQAGRRRQAAQGAALCGMMARAQQRPADGWAPAMRRLPPPRPCMQTHLPPPARGAAPPGACAGRQTSAGRRRQTHTWPSPPAPAQTPRQPGHPPPAPRRPAAWREGGEKRESAAAVSGAGSHGRATHQLHMPQARQSAPHHTTSHHTAHPPA